MRKAPKKLNGTHMSIYIGRRTATDLVVKPIIKHGVNGGEGIECHKPVSTEMPPQIAIQEGKYTDGLPP